VVEFKVSRAIIAKICFTDGICWAAKISKILPRDRATAYGIEAMILVEDYCPNIPIGKLMGSFRNKVRYYFTQWIEGRNLLDEVFGSRVYARVGETFSIPKAVVTSLAEFVYNLTTCPIPRKNVR